MIRENEKLVRKCQKLIFAESKIVFVIEKLPVGVNNFYFLQFLLFQKKGKFLRRGLDKFFNFCHNN